MFFAKSGQNLQNHKFLLPEMNWVVQMYLVFESLETLNASSFAFIVPIGTSTGELSWILAPLSISPSSNKRTPYPIELSNKHLP